MSRVEKLHVVWAPSSFGGPPSPARRIVVKIGEREREEKDGQLSYTLIDDIAMLDSASLDRNVDLLFLEYLASI